MIKTIALDTESFYSKDFGLQVLGTHKYAHDVRCDVYLMSICDGTETWAGHPRDFNFDSLNGNILLSHNAAHDQEIYLGQLARGLWPKINFKEWHCTANLSAYVCNRRSLAEASEFLLGVQVSKGMRDWMKGRTWDDAVREGKAEELLKYARDDAQLCFQLWDKCGAQWPEWERRLSNLTIEQGRRGVHVHRERLEAGIQTLQRVILQATDKLPWVAAGRAQASPIGVAEECRKAGIPCPPVKAHDADAAAEWEETYSASQPWVKALKDLRKAKKTLATLETMRDRIRDDGTMGFSLKYFGAHCVPGDHEVLTRDGWKRIDEWTEATGEWGDIMQFTSKGELRFAAARPNRFDDVDEALLNCSSGQVSFSATEGHWCMVVDKHGRLIKRQAADLMHGRGSVLLSAPRATEASAPLTDIQIQLRVAVQADGHYLHDCRSIRFRFTKARKIERLKALLTESGITWRENCFPSEPNVTVINLPGFPRWLENAKIFDYSLLEYSQAQLDVFLDELSFWDGHRENEDSVVYYTTHRQNAEWVQTAAHLAGRAATIKHHERKAEGRSALYNVFIRRARASRVSRKDWKIEKTQAGTVYCPTALHGTFLMRCGHYICITGNTGRWAGDAGINFQNFNREPLFVRPDFTFEDDRKIIAQLAEQHDKNPDDPQLHCLDIRGLLLPPPGMKIGAVDLSQIEPRVANYLAGNHALLQKIKEGFPIYEAHARESMGWTGGVLKKENKKVYSLAKARVIGLNYGCAWEKFIAVARIMAQIDITEDDEAVAMKQSWDGVIYRQRDGKPCEPFVKARYAAHDEFGQETFVEREVPVYGANSRAIVKDFRETNPLIVAMWQQLQKALEDAVGSDLVVELPSGRKLTYRAVRKEFRTYKDPETGASKTKTVFTAEVDGRRKIFYGGLIFENICQAVGRDTFAVGLLRIIDAGIWSMWTVHDESVNATHSLEEGERARQLMAVTPDWLPGCPIEAELVVSDRYRK